MKGREEPFEPLVYRFPEQQAQEKVAGILGVARRTIDEWEGTSNVKDDNTSNPPDLRIKVTKKGKQKIKVGYSIRENTVR